MKSFADWTQDIAESVGEVSHHWETKPEAPSIEPSWAAPGAKLFYCDQCNNLGSDVRPAQSTASGIVYDLCDACTRSNNYVRTGP